MVLFWQMEQIDAPEERFLEAMIEGLEEHLGRAVAPEIVVHGYELSYCLRQTHILAGPILSYLLAGRPLLFGTGDPEMELALVDKLMARVERGAERL